MYEKIKQFFKKYYFIFVGFFTVLTAIIFRRNISDNRNRIDTIRDGNKDLERGINSSREQIRESRENIRNAKSNLDSAESIIERVRERGKIKQD